MLGIVGAAIVVAAIVVSMVRTAPDQWPAAAGATHLRVPLPAVLEVLGDDVIEARVSDAEGRLSVLLPADSASFESL